MEFSQLSILLCIHETEAAAVNQTISVNDYCVN